MTIHSQWGDDDPGAAAMREEFQASMICPFASFDSDTARAAAVAACLVGGEKWFTLSELIGLITMAWPHDDHDYSFEEFFVLHYAVAMPNGDNDTRYMPDSRKPWGSIRQCLRELEPAAWGNLHLALLERSEILLQHSRTAWEHSQTAQAVYLHRLRRPEEALALLDIQLDHLDARDRHKMLETLLTALS